MILGRVVGTVVATRKDPRLEGHKLLIVKPVTPDGKDEPATSLPSTPWAPATVTRLHRQWSSARMADGCKDKPVDCVIVGIVDEVSLDAAG